MSLAERTDALLALIEDDRRAQCESVLVEARAQAAALAAQARAQARAQLHEALQRERARLADALAAARAELQTRRRLHEQRRIEALLARGWQRLPQVLAARWSGADTRRAWIAQALERALELLPRPGRQTGAAADAGAWTVAWGGDWPEAERLDTAARIAQRTGAAPAWRQDARIAAGLRIGAAGNVVDATAAGLLADRDEVGGRLIGLLQEPSA
ncbi:MAG: hypothetical protein AMXMBFR66_25430 [Pseudomonadota bacterium]|nr:hypothetical protein [Rubrivivax sp.]